MIVQTSFKGSCNGPTIQVDPRAKRLASNFPSLYVDLVGGDIYVLYDMPFFLALAQGWTFWSGDLQMWSKWAPTNIKLFCLSNIH